MGVWRRVLVGGAVIALAWSWWTFRPARFGGDRSYTIVSGSSMKPILQPGDLAVLRLGGAYRPGKVVAYRTPSGTVVLHRIIRRVGARYVLQGDNNSWVDPYEPTAGEVLGHLERRLPKAGRLIEALRRPGMAAVTVGIVSFVIGWRHQERHRRRPAPASWAVGAVMAVVVLGTALIGPAFAAANRIPPSKIGVTARSISANDLKPTACAGIAVQRLVTGSGTVQGSNDKELILGGPGPDILKGIGEKDCLVGGAGNDTLNGGNDHDVCLGGPGGDSFANCENVIR